MSDNGSWKVGEDMPPTLILSFPDQSETFVLGFEGGKLWERMRSGTESEIEAATHTKNRELIQRMATADGWTLECKASEVEGWDFTTLTKTKALSRFNPHGLRVVKSSTDTAPK